MNGIPREKIIDYFLDRQCEIIQIEEDAHSGKEWIGFRYFIRSLGAAHNIR